MLGISKATLLNWEKCHSKPSAEYIPSILEFIPKDPRSTPATMGAFLVRFREDRGLDQAAFAAEIGVDVTTLARWERDEKLPWGSCLLRLRNALGCPALEPKTLGQWIEHNRALNDISKRELSRRLKVSHHTIWCWEKGQKAPRSKRLQELSSLFGENVPRL